MNTSSNLSLTFTVKPEVVFTYFENLSKFQRLPQIPCVNCSRMVSLTSDDSIDITLQGWRTLFSENYKSEFAELRLLTGVTEDRRMCYTCKEQVS